ncbi:MAG: Spy/CpxP family protein refolding chaperone [Paracoccaceae bacterium]|nr:Spy/CpxP family protein refolding chaperone [Paracoccaceae bacterium]
MTFRPTRPLLALTLAAALAAPALAQGWMMQGEGRGPGMMQGMGPGMMRGWSDGDRGPMGGMRGMMGDPGRFVAGRLAFIEAELGITKDQRPLWDAYAEAARDAAGSMAAMHERMGSMESTPSLPQRLALMEEMMAGRLSALQTVREEVEALYEALTPEQQGVADDIMGMGMGMM